MRAAKGVTMPGLTGTGKYRCAAIGTLEATAYVEAGGASSFVAEAVYRTHGYSPEFDVLPTAEEYEAGQRQPDPNCEKRSVDARSVS
jgi:hypothetical protein